MSELNSIQLSANAENLNYKDFSIPEAISTAGWTVNSRGYTQQTFLGASITRFTMNGQYGDTSSTLSVELVVDEHNKSDQLPQGLGDDIYHNGKYDFFVPPVAGSPVFFKFGKNFATIEEAFLGAYEATFNLPTSTSQTQSPTPLSSVSEINNVVTPAYDTNYPFNQLSKDQLFDTETRQVQSVSQESYGTTYGISNRGKSHLTFGGILQSYTQNRNTNGNPTYSVQVVDPREILSNSYLVLNNYTGTTYNNDNIFNIYGFLEYNPTDSLISELKNKGYVESVLTRKLSPDGSISYEGSSILDPTKLDLFYRPVTTIFDRNSPLPQLDPKDYPPDFPITGTGFSRRGPQGIPFYRIKQAILTLFEYNGRLPDEYKVQSFGNTINFRGFKYVVDFSGLPNLPDLYYFDFDQMSMLDFALEICDITSKDLFVTLLPVINHPLTSYIHNRNMEVVNNGGPFTESTSPIFGQVHQIERDLIAGIIRLDAIDRSSQPEYGAIKEYIDSLKDKDIYVENQDVGYELSNVTTDKFIVGAQQVDMYTFPTFADRKLNQKSDAWSLDKIIDTQQMIPYYGKLGKYAVTIPKGFGAYQQILLDTTSLNANGVGNYYVTTELELRAAMISYDRWKEFLLEYNDKYLEPLIELDPITGKMASTRGGKSSEPPDEIKDYPTHPDLGDNDDIYFVTVPRSVWPSDKQSFTNSSEYVLLPESSKLFAEIQKLDIPTNTCNPPYGWPLYYKRATQLGIPEAGYTSISGKAVEILTNFAKLDKEKTKDNFEAIINNLWLDMTSLFGDPSIVVNEDVKTHYEQFMELIKKVKSGELSLGLIARLQQDTAKVLNSLPRVTKKANNNAMQVHKFLQNIANECLGKKYLVKIPKRVNLNWDKKSLRINFDINGSDTSFDSFSGPYGFKPLPRTSGVTDEFSQSFRSQISGYKSSYPKTKEYSFCLERNNKSEKTDTGFEDFFTTTLGNFAGALENNYNPILDQYEFNYTPTQIGGFFDFDLYANLNAEFGKEINEKCNHDTPPVNFVQLPTAAQDKLAPLDLTNFINEQGRISPYVRFDHSQFLNLEGLNSTDFTQQKIVNNSMVPDLVEDLDNTQSEDLTNIRIGDCSKKIDDKANKDEEDAPESIVFVKCSIDENFYMTPKLKSYTINVYGNDVKDIGKLSKAMKVWDKETKEFKTIQPYREAHFIPIKTKDNLPTVNIIDFERKYTCELDGNIIDPSINQLDSENVYALITIPGRISPLKDSRFQDGPYQLNKPESFKHFMCMDVIKHKDFNIPPFAEGPFPTTRSESDCIANPNEDPNQASNLTPIDAYKKAVNNLNYALPNLIQFTVASPVYPSICVLPLMSRDRCYGPWISSQVDGKAQVFMNIGGKVEFIKDENLAPWNYAGYKLMDDAGKLQATFSNSLLLFSERGGFVVPDAPENVTLGKELRSKGPLITNISVDISTAGIHTTYQLDLYTASFGKMQKAKEKEISNISREKQKLRDERNALLRKGLGKGQMSQNYILQQSKMLSDLSRPEQAINEAQDINAIYTNNIVASVNTNNNQSNAFGDTVVKHKETQVSVSNQTSKSLGSVGENFGDASQQSKAYYNSAGGSMGDFYTPVSLEIYHPNMPSKPDPFISARQLLYPKSTDFNIDESDITFYEV